MSPLSIIAPIFSRAFYHKFGADSDKPVIAQIPVDLRQFVPSMTTRYFICFIDLPYLPEYQALSLPEVFAKTRAFLESQMHEEQLLFRAKRASDACRELHERDIPLAEKEQLARKITRDFVQEDSFLITNVGQFTLPACMLPYIEEYGAVLPCAAQPFAMLISSYNGKMKLSIAQRDHDLTVCSELTQTLCALGIEAKLESYAFCVTKYDGANAAQR